VRLSPFQRQVLARLSIPHRGYCCLAGELVRDDVDRSSYVVRDRSAPFGGYLVEKGWGRSPSPRTLRRLLDLGLIAVESREPSTERLALTAAGLRVLVGGSEPDASNAEVVSPNHPEEESSLGMEE
jgi:hypothetical protein